MFLIVLEDEPPVGLDSIHVLSLSSRYKMCRIVWNVLCVKTYVSISCWMSTTSNFKNFEYLNILLRFPRRWIAKLWSSKDTNFNFGTMSIHSYFYFVENEQSRVNESIEKLQRVLRFPRSTSIVYTIRELESISSRYIFISFFSRSLYDKTPSLRYSAVTSNIGYKFPVYRISRFVIV